jgi:2,3-bisphosphoglycerate-independent phosphoglycerate mutase, archaeal form
MKRYKTIIISIDGLGDRPVRQLSALTPLEAAVRPNLNTLAREGIVGIVDPYAPGIPCGTDTGHLCMLGYDPRRVYSGRGPIEAVGAGLALSPGDVAFRCNFATVDDNNIVVDRRAGRIRHTAGLAAPLNGLELGEGITATFAPATEHRAVLVLRGAGLSARVTDSDPGGTNEGNPVATVMPLDDSPEAAKTAKAVNRFLTGARNILREHPLNLQRQARRMPQANAVITRSGGVMPHIAPIAELHNGLKGAVVSGETTVLAIAKMAGLFPLTNEGMTGSYDFDPMAKAQATIGLIQEYDFVLTHVKATDLAGHDGRWDLKRDMIEMIDTMIGAIRSQLPPDMYIAVTADHSTPCSRGEHSGDPVPALIWGPEVRADNQESFGERSCANGGLGRLTGSTFFNSLLDLMGYVKKFGA